MLFFSVRVEEQHSLLISLCICSLLDVVITKVSLYISSDIGFDQYSGFTRALDCRKFLKMYRSKKRFNWSTFSTRPFLFQSFLDVCLNIKVMFNELFR